MQNNNSSISQDMNRIFDLKGESTSFVMDYIQPVINISPRCNICKGASAINATSAGIYTTPSDKDFYLASALLSVIKDVTSTSTLTSILAFIDGVQQSILRIGGISLTPQSDVVALSFNIPIKIDRNTAITVSNSTNVANVTAQATIQGFTVETTK